MQLVRATDERLHFKQFNIKRQTETDRERYSHILHPHTVRQNGHDDIHVL